MAAPGCLQKHLLKLPLLSFIPRGLLLQKKKEGTKHFPGDGVDPDHSSSPHVP